jgi:hypothetical protein
MLGLRGSVHLHVEYRESMCEEDMDHVDYDRLHLSSLRRKAMGVEAIRRLCSKWKDLRRPKDHPIDVNSVVSSVVQ